MTTLIVFLVLLWTVFAFIVLVEERCGASIVSACPMIFFGAMTLISLLSGDWLLAIFYISIFFAVKEFSD